MTRWLFLLTLLVLPWTGHGAERRHTAERAPAAERGVTWQRVAPLESGSVQYVDLATLTRERGWLRVRTLLDHRTPVSWPKSKAVRSEIDTQFIDCGKRRFQVIESLAFVCNMGRCSAIEQFRAKSPGGDFKAMPTLDSPLATAYTMACKAPAR